MLVLLCLTLIFGHRTGGRISLQAFGSNHGSIDSSGGPTSQSVVICLCLLAACCCLLPVWCTCAGVCDICVYVCGCVCWCVCVCACYVYATFEVFAALLVLSSTHGRTGGSRRPYIQATKIVPEESTLMYPQNLALDKLHIPRPGSRQRIYSTSQRG